MREIAPGLFQLRGLIPNAINVYLAGDVLIDAATKLSSRRILGQIQDRPLSLHALTHVHPDHQGASHAICEARHIPLACHADGVDAMEGRAPVQTSDPNNPVNKVIGAVWEGPPHPVGRVLAEGDDVAGFRVIHAPGHAPSEVIFFRDSDRVAICGDVVNAMNLLTMRPGIREPPDAFSLDPARNRESIKLLAELEPSLICAGHGPPSRDLAGLKQLAASF
ncbi:MAG: MBL fold metallo-hydrolase [Solirubrobacterales bacterium]|nr:MBL fold metallo-hydrolase [Thermoleophilales bacterium]MCO5327138.1 MBL fold metallo-hydrolase [Solirubrobacterales bacterium]